MMRIGRSAGANEERGATLVEFAIVLPLLVVLLLGIAEFGWAVAQQLDLRSRSREVLRVLVVDGTVAEVQDRACGDDVVKAANITAITRGGVNDPKGEATVTMTANIEQITGFFGWAWGGATTISTNVVGRNEQPATNVTTGSSVACP